MEVCPRFSIIVPWNSYTLVVWLLRFSFCDMHKMEHVALIILYIRKTQTGIKTYQIQNKESIGLVTNIYNIRMLLYCRYQHSRQLVVALNRFADIRADLPQNWEKKLNREGKVCICVHVHTHYFTHRMTIIQSLGGKPTGFYSESNTNIHKLRRLFCLEPTNKRYWNVECVKSRSHYAVSRLSM